MLWYGSFITISLLLDITFCNLFNPSFTNFTIHRLEKCDEEKDFNIFLHLNNFKVIKQNGINVTLTGIIQLMKPVEINFRLSVHGLICDGPEDRTCKHSFVKRFGYICRKLHEPDQPWYPFLKEKFACPISVGYYDLGKSVIDVNTLSYLPLSDGYWVVKAYGYAGSDIVMCVYSEIDIVDLLSRRSKIFTKP